MPLVIEVEDLSSRKTGRFVFTRSPVHVGRSELNDLCLPVPFVSLFHGVVRFQNSDVLYVDTGSRNGSQLDGAQMRNGVPTPVGPKAAVLIGTLKLRFAVEASAVPQSPEVVRRLLFGEQRERIDAIAGGTRVLTVGNRGDERATAEPSVPARSESDPATLAVPAVRFPAPSRTAAPVGARDGEAGATVIVRNPLERAPAGAAAASAAAPVSPPPPVGSPEPVLRTAGVQEVVGALTRDYSLYRSRFAVMLEAVESRLPGLSAEERRSALKILSARYPALLQEHQFQELAQRHGVAPPPPPPPASGTVIVSDSLEPMRQAPAERGRYVAAMLALNNFAQAYAPSTPSLETGTDVATFLDRVGQALEAFAKAFVELQKGYEQFGAEVAVRVGDNATPLGRARSLQEVLRFLLEPHGENEQPIEELTRTYADLMIHQVALMNATRAGAKGLLQQLSPEVLDRSGGGGLRKKLFGHKEAWDRFVERHLELLEDENQLTGALFGPEFARAYTAIAGGSFDEE